MEVIGGTNLDRSFSDSSVSASPAVTLLSSFGSSERPREDVEGDIVSSFTLGPVVGYGTSSTVRQAFPASGGIVAVKIINSHDHSEDGNAALARKRIEQEISIWSKLSHEHVLPLLSAVHTTFADYRFTIYCPSGTLLDLLKRDGSPALPWDDAGMIFKQVVKGLRYLHEDALVVHGDLTLENVLVDEAGSCRIGGFGMARKIGTRDDEDASAQSALQVERTTEHRADTRHAECQHTAFDYKSGGIKAPETG
ncbi:putative protein tyrosine kinase [Lyophyllum shimeji]|uniref:Protein kinase domain-containing protein n=1 Tax=Lyophyllum shimeji TaxID=47721 RepID=A0A9P3Q2C6_LYOSH|nr:putative protein tyrosine kinase [Lyophyllum shimeji]